MALHYPLTEEAIEGMNAKFYQLYDSEHWFYKIKTFDILLDSTEEFVNELGDEELQKKPVEEYRRAIESEIVATFYHISESLFMLMHASFSSVPWLVMKHMRMSDIAEFVRETVLEKELEDEEIEWIFYPDMKPPSEHEGTLEESIEFIEEYLARMGTRFLDNDIYNEYKHGLRLSTTKGSLRIAPEKEPGGETGKFRTLGEGTAHVYLEEELIEKDGSEDRYKLNEVTSGFDYELFLSMSRINYLLIDQIIRARRAENIKSSDRGDRIEVTSFHVFDIEDVFDYDPRKTWKHSISYAVGDEEITIS